jgi:hypothetical protein
VIEYIIVGLAFIVFVAVVGVVLIAGLVRLARRPKAAPPMPLMASFSEAIRPAVTAPAPPPADFLGLAMAYQSARENEEKIGRMKKALDGIAFWTSKLPGPDAPAATPTPPNA